MGARPSAFEGAVKPETARVWSTQHEAIFNWFQYEPLSRKHDEPDDTPPMNLVVTARAGATKTSTIIEGVNRAPEDRILVCAFSKLIAEELASRITNPSVQVKTLHALGYQMVRQQWRGTGVNEKPGERADSLTDAVFKPLKEKVPFLIRSMVSQLHTKAREMTPLDISYDVVAEIAYRFNHVPDDGWGKYDEAFVVNSAVEAMMLAATVEPDYNIGIDYADMIYLPLAWRLTARDYQLVVVDEAQDMTMAQLEIAERVCDGRICIVGDDRQCQPAGTMVRSSASGNVPIESLCKGDTIESFDRHGQVFIKSGRVNEVASRPYKGELINVAAVGCVSRSTPNHKWLVRWSDKSQRTWITYLMRKGGLFRVGQCQMFRQGCKNFGLSERARVEQADSAWILQTHDNLEQALAYERILSCRYGLPEMVFFPPSNIKHFTQPVIDAVYSALQNDGIGLYRKALNCLKDHGRDICYPIYSRPNVYERRGRTTLFETQACNLMSGYMSVPIAPQTISGHDKKDRHAVTWAPIAVWREDFEGLVYSLDIERYHKYVADGLVTCNCIFGFRGADSSSLARLKRKLAAVELPLTVSYRCPASVVREAKRLVSDIEARPETGEGVVDECGYGEILALAKPHDFILSRTNAPLVALVLKFARKGIRARMVGRDIGKEITKILTKLKCAATTPIDQTIERIEEWRRKQTTKLAASGHQNLCWRVHDQADMLVALCEDNETTGDVLRAIESLFTDDTEGGQVVCSSVHKAKGLESRRCFLLMDTFYRFGSSPEEHNIMYVAITRARQHLTYVR